MKYIISSYGWYFRLNGKRNKNTPNVLVGGLGAEEGGRWWLQKFKVARLSSHDNAYEMRPAIVSGDAPGQLLADFSPSLVTVSRSFCEVSFSFLKWQVVEHKRRPKVISKIQNGGQKIGKQVKVGSFSNNDGDGYENVTQKEKSRCLKLYRDYSISFNFWRWILKDCIKVQEKKKKVFVLCPLPRQNVKLGIFTLQSCNDG